MRERDKPTIFIFTTAYEPFIGGAEIAIKEITERLKNEFRFFIFTSRFRPDLPKYEETNGVVIRRIGFGFFPFDKFLLPFLGFFVVLRHIRRERPVLFWGVMASFASGIPYLVNLVRPMKPIPVVLTLQEGDSIEHIKGAKFGLVDISWKAALSRTKYLTAISAFLFDLGREFGYQGEGKIIPNGVDVSAFAKGFPPGELKLLRERLGIATDEKIIITTSRLVEKNAVDIIIRAASILVKKNEKVKLLIIGSGEKGKELRRLAELAGVSDRTVFLGAIPHAEIAKYLKIADVFTRPSRSEGFGNSFIEAMAAGVPVIGTMVGGIIDFLEDGRTGLAVKVDSPEDLAQKIEKILKAPALRVKLMGEGLKMAQDRYQWAMIASEFRTIFNRLSKSGSKLRILIATPIFPPSIGGPANFAEKLAGVFLKEGYPVSVLAYGGKKDHSDTRAIIETVSSDLLPGIKHFVYFIKILRLLFKSDAVIALDPFIVGFPALFAVRILRKNMVLRIEGDFLWETYVERTGEEITLKKFYEAFYSRRLNLKERTVFSFSKFVVNHVDALVFSSAWRKKIFNMAFLSAVPSLTIAPPWPEIREQEVLREKVIIYAGRFIKVKNLVRFLRAFLALHNLQFRLELIGDGPEKDDICGVVEELGAADRVSIMPPLEHSELLKRLASSHAFVLPSLSEVGPNVILDCIRTVTPFLLTKETGFYETLEDIGLFADTLDEDDLKEKLRSLFDDVRYREYKRRLGGFGVSHSWQEIAYEWAEVLSGKFGDKT